MTKKKIHLIQFEDVREQIVSIRGLATILIAVLTLAACTSDEYVGDAEALRASDAIAFGSEAGRFTRATSNTGSVNEMLDGQFKVYGVKNVQSGAPLADHYSDVFKDYVVWWNNTSSTTSNPDQDWEYVGTTSQTYGAASTTLAHNQTIKYWDHAAANYHFVAGSPVSSFTFNITDGDIASATVSGLAGHLNANPSSTALTTNPVYIADPVNVPEASFRNEVSFSFVRQQSFVRVGIYETIPGYSISDIKFYPYGDSGWDTTPSGNIILASTTADYFRGASNGTATITYNWTGTPSYTYSYESSSLTTAKNWYAGALTGVKATTSNHATVGQFYGTDQDMEAATGYFTVLPMPSGTTAAPLLIKCDYTLRSLTTAEGGDNTGETITVHGATAAIPAAFALWAPNTQYTYIFKISDNTNGKTNPDKDKVGLYPISFDAVATATTTADGQGYVTTVTTPSITTYQDGSVTATGVKYTPGTAIYFTAQDETTGILKTLTTTDNTVGNVKVFWLGTTAKTEADLQLTAPTTEVATDAPSGSTAMAIGAADWNHDGQTIPANNYATFTPGAAGYYAIRYQTATSPDAAYTYKVVHVE
ncbi:MAG: hypothetical protein IJ142_05295 [Bacteroidaceae bacterium]|nr:hypothetical protein [Bacteroidaceae bacterium]